MAANKSQLRPIGVLESSERESAGGFRNAEQNSWEARKFEYVWKNIFGLALLHIGAVYGLWLVVSGQAMMKSFIFGK